MFGLTKKERLEAQLESVKSLISQYSFIFGQFQELKGRLPTKSELEGLRIRVQQLLSLNIDIKWDLFTVKNLTDAGFTLNQEFANDALKNRTLYGQEESAGFFQVQKVKGFLQGLTEIKRVLDLLIVRLTQEAEALQRDNIGTNPEAYAASSQNYAQLIKNIESLLSGINQDLNNAITGQNELLCGVRYGGVRARFTSTSNIPFRKLAATAALASALLGIGMGAKSVVSGEYIMKANIELSQEVNVDQGVLNAARRHGIVIDFYPGERKMIVRDRITRQKLTEFTARGGPETRYQDPRQPSHWYGPTRAGTYKLRKDTIGPFVSRGGSWEYARIKFGALIREQDGEIQVSENEGRTWFFVTGSQAKVQGLKKSDFYVAGVLLNRWILNPFGHVSIKMQDSRGHISESIIHTNVVGEITRLAPEGFGNLVQPISHGCVHMSPREINSFIKVINAATGDVMIVVHSYTASS